MNRNQASKLYFLLQDFRREPVKDAILDLRNTLNYSANDLSVLQANRLSNLLQHSVKHIPFYQKKYKEYLSKIGEAGSAEKIFELIDRLPILTKKEVIENRQDISLKSPVKYGTTQNITSGSTGDPLNFPCDNLSWAYRHASFHRCMELHGVKVGDPYGYFFGLHWGRAGRWKVMVKDLIFNRIRVSAFDINYQMVEKNFSALLRNKVVYFLGYPSAIYDFCQIANEIKLNLSELGLKAIFTTAEPLLDYQRSLIEESTGAKCVNFYGSVEGGAGIFEGSDGLLYENSETTHFYIHDGELFCTDLFLYSFPLIKYQIGDFAELDSPEQKMFDRRCYRNILGRSGAPITLPNGKTINANLPSYIFKGLINKNLVKKYRFYQKSDKVILKVVPFNSHRTRVEEQLKKEIKSAFGNDIKIDVRFVSNLPLLPNAKHRDYIIE